MGFIREIHFFLVYYNSDDLCKYIKFLCLVLSLSALIVGLIFAVMALIVSWRYRDMKIIETA